jgi:acyl-coenzyme A synthetase/AMP-(fatty) acid ligase
MSEIAAALDHYRRQCDEFRADVPTHFNFGRDVVDRFARNPAQPALLWRNADGLERRLSFEDVRRASNRVAQLLDTLELGPGHSLILMLPRVPEWHIVSVGALKAGVLLIPSSTLLRPKDIAYRANHSGAAAIVAWGDARAAVD